MEALLSVHEVAAIMRIHHKKVQRLARTGVLPCIKIGAVYRFRAATLENWISKSEVSERKFTKEGEEVRRGSLGIQVSRRGPSDASADSLMLGISKRCVS